ncbi:dihydroorotase [Calditrichota bacterium]
MTDNSIRIPKGWQAGDADKIAFRNARLYDPANNIDQIADLVIEDGKVFAVGSIPAGWDGKLVEASGWLITPGLFDMHVHLREPGQEHKETVKTGCMAAIAGGFTGVACMPNTSPPIDDISIVEMIRERAELLPVDVHPVPAVTRGRKGDELSEIGEMVDGGVTGFTDDGSPVESAGLMRNALEYTKMFNAVMIEHCEDRDLVGSGVMHEGETSTQLGLPGWPSIGEEVAVARNIQLADFTGGRIHIAHISTAGSAELVRQAKARGVKVTAEVTPHHLTLDCSLLKGYDTNYKVNPPLRSAEDVRAMIEALKDGTIDAIATDHAPHAHDEKEVEFLFAPFGMVGLETAFSIILTKLVNPGELSLERAIDAMVNAPRRILNLTQPGIVQGVAANLSIFNPEEEWVVDNASFLSKSRNTPFHGWSLKGKACGVVNKNLYWLRANGQ